MTLKYIITQHGATLFPERETHSQVAKGLGKIYSAGIAIIQSYKDDFLVQCTVGSTSLDIPHAKGYNSLRDQIIVKDTLSPIPQAKYLSGFVEAFYKKSKKA